MLFNAALITPVDLPLPHLPAELEGLRVAHVSDLHIDRPRARLRRLAAEMADAEVDLLLWTGDYMDYAGDEPASLEIMAGLCRRLKPRLGAFGVFGNHDTAKLRRMFAELPVQWLDDVCHRLDGLPLELLGVRTLRHQLPDSVALLADVARRQGWSGPRDGGQRPLRLMLAHYPMYLPTAADLGVDVVFSGHTHGGQCRLPTRMALYNSSDLPKRLSSGILRQHDTLCVVSRGLGETFLPLRLFCPPHAPVYTLRRGPMPGQSTSHVVNVKPW